MGSLGMQSASWGESVQKKIPQEKVRDSHWTKEGSWKSWKSSKQIERELVEIN